MKKTTRHLIFAIYSHLGDDARREFRAALAQAVAQSGTKKVHPSLHSLMAESTGTWQLKRDGFERRDKICFEPEN